MTKAERVRLGAFLLGGGVALFGGMAILAGLKVVEDRDVYYVSFEESVTGLEPSAAVRYQGLRVGRVDRLKVNPEDPTQIQARLSLEPDTVLYEGTTAVLDMSGLTGLKTINLSAGDPRSEVIEPGSEIPAEASLVGKIADRAELISKRVEQVTENLAMWTGPDNRRRFERFIEGADQLVRDVDVMVVDTREPLVAALEEVTKTGAAVREASTEAAITMRDVRDELRNTLVAARQTLEQARRVLAAVDVESLQRTVRAASNAMSSLERKLTDEQLEKTFQNFQVALANVTRLVQSLDLTVRASREDLVLSLKHVRQATEDLREFSRIIAQDPSVLLRGTEVGE